MNDSDDYYNQKEALNNRMWKLISYVVLGFISVLFWRWVINAIVDYYKDKV